MSLTLPDQQQRILSLLPAGVYVCDAEGRITFFNQKAVELWGYEPKINDDSQKFCACCKVFLPDGTFIPPDKTPMAIALKSGQSFRNVEATVERPDGSRFYASVNIDPLFDEEDRICGAINIFQDVSNIKKAENAVRQSETKWRMMVDSTAVLIWVNGPQGHCQFVNRAYAQFFGWEPEKLLGLGWTKFIHPDDSNSYLDRYHAAENVRAEFSTELRVRRADGKWRWLLSRGIPHYSSTGEFVGYVGNNTDITEIKDAEQASRQLAAIVESSEDAIMSKDINGIVSSWNAAAERLYGFAPHEIIGQPIAKVIPPELRGEDSMILERLRKGERIEHYETVRLRKNGTRIDVSLTISPIKDKYGNILGVSKIARDITERKRSDAALRDSEERLRLAIDAGKVGTWDWDILSNKVTWSEQIYKFHGLKSSDFDGTVEAFSKMIHPDDRIRVQKAIEASVETFRPYSSEMRIIRPNGEVRWIATNGRVLAGPDGKAVRMLGATVDVTDQRNTEQALWEQTRSLEIINMVGKTLAAELDLNKLVQAVTEAASRICGAEFGAFFYNAKDEKDESYILYALYGAPRETFEKLGMPRNTPLFSQIFNGEGIMRLGDVTKDPRYVKMSPHQGIPEDHPPIHSYLAVPVVSRSGEVLGGLFFGHSKIDVFTEEDEKIVIGIAAQAAVAIDNANLYQTVQKELDEHKRMEEALRNSESRFRHLADAMPQIVWITKADGKVEYFNKRWYEFTGLPEGKISDEDWTSVLHPDDVRRTLETWSSAVETEGIYEIEYRFKDRKTNEYRWFLGRAVPIKDKEGHVLHWFGTTTDIQDQKQDQQRLQMIAEELARSNADLEQFAYVASHDLQEPLHMISSFVDLLHMRCEKKLEDGEKEYLQFIQQGSIQAMTLIRELLEYSRIGRDKTYQTVDMESVVAEVTANLKISIHENSAEIKHDPLPSIIANRLEMVQLFQNIVSNSIKYRAKQPPQIYIAVQELEKGVQFRIRDNGIGIDPQYKERIFLMFQRLHTKDEYSGSGIGLAICKKIVEHHGGKIWVESQPGEGSTFCFTINMNHK